MIGNFHIRLANGSLEKAHIPRQAAMCSGRSSVVRQPLRYIDQPSALHEGFITTHWREEKESLRWSRCRLRSAQNPDLIEQLVGAIFGKKVPHSAYSLGRKISKSSEHLLLPCLSSLNRHFMHASASHPLTPRGSVRNFPRTRAPSSLLFCTLLGCCYYDDDVVEVCLSMYASAHSVFKLYHRTVGRV